MPLAIGQSGVLGSAFVVLVAVALSSCGGDSGAAPADSPVNPGDSTAGDSNDDAFADATDDGEAASETTPWDAAAEPKLTTKTFVESAEDFLNPERGLFDGGGIELVDTSSYDSFRKSGFTMVYGKARLDAFRTSAISATWLGQFEAGLARVRKAGIKLVLRFVYNDPSTYPPPPPTGDDASDTQILAHLAQLAPVLAKNADVIALLEAGFIGYWGEWHGSTNGLSAPAARKKILDAILAALPKSRMVAVRTPAYKKDWYATTLTDAEAFTGVPQARVGHHNDCVFASDTDEGTYDPPPIEPWLTYLAQETRFVPMGGESCRDPSEIGTRSSVCPDAMKEFARFHWTFYNQFYHPGVFKQWVGTCRDEIAKRLGYRIMLLSISRSEAVRPGGILVVSVKLKNVGWAAMFNPRRLLLVLGEGASKRMATFAAVDPRKWEPGKEASFDAKFRVPAAATNGTYKLSLWLPDDADAIRDRPEYAVHLANDGVWDAATGVNTFATDFAIDDKALGSVDASAKDFVALP